MLPRVDRVTSVTVLPEALANIASQRVRIVRLSPTAAAITGRTLTVDARPVGAVCGQNEERFRFRILVKLHIGALLLLCLTSTSDMGEVRERRVSKVERFAIGHNRRDLGNAAP